MYVDFTTTVNKFEVNKFFGTPQDMIPRGVIFFELKIKMITTSSKFSTKIEDILTCSSLILLGSIDE